MIVKPNQSLLDIILQGCGTMEAGIQVSVDNGFPINYFPSVGDNIMISSTAVTLGDTGILKYLGQNGIIIGTKGALTGVPLITEDGEQDFTTEDSGDVLVNEN